jgi:hypothetical protein
MTSDTPPNQPGPRPADLASAHRQGTTDHPSERRRPTAKCTNRQMLERIILVSGMIARRAHKHEIKKILREKYGIGARQAEVYFARARKRLIKRSGRPREDHIAEAFALYENTIRNPESDLKDKLAAQRELNQLLGLYAPLKVAPTNIAGDAPAEIITSAMKDLTMEELQTLSKLRQRMAAITSSDQGDGETN